MQTWFEHDGGFDLVSSEADIPANALGWYQCDESGFIFRCEGSCEYMFGQNEAFIFND